MPRQTSLRLAEPKEDDPLEAWHQEQIFYLCELNKAQYPELADLYAVPNGGFRHKSTAKAMQRQGVKPGVPDMALDQARGGWFGLRIELKRFRNGSVSEEQKQRIERLRASGYRAVVCWGWRSAWAEILRYLSLPPTVPTSLPPPYNPFARKEQ